MTATSAKRVLQTSFAMVALLLFDVGSSYAETLDQLYEKAKLDKTLVFGRSCRAARKPGQGVHAEIPWHYGDGDRRFQQRAE
jgi:hypothetical protein